MTLNAGGLSMFDAARAMGLKFREDVTPRDAWVTLNGLKFHYLDWGNAHLPPMILLHGSSQTAHTWDFACLSLRDRYHCIALDQRGHGDTDWSPTKEYGLLYMVSDLEELFKALKLPPAVVVGLSMGGRNTYTFAAKHPQHVRGVVIVDSGPEMGRPGSGREERAEQLRRETLEANTLDEFVDAVHRWNPRRPKEQLWGSIKNNVRQRPDGKWAWKFDTSRQNPEQRDRRDYLTADNRWDFVKEVQCPAFLIIGADSDVMSREGGEKMVKALKHGEMVVVERAGHLVPGDNPVDFIKVTQAWLDKFERGAVRK